MAESAFWNCRRNREVTGGWMDLSAHHDDQLFSSGSRRYTGWL
jgi:hypothetical protein